MSLGFDVTWRICPPIRYLFSHLGPFLIGEWSAFRLFLYGKLNICDELNIFLTGFICLS